MKTLFLLLLFSPLALAQEKRADILFPHLMEKNFLSHLDRSPTDQFLGIRLATLTKEARQVRYAWNNKGFVSGSGGERTGGAHFVSRRLVVVNSLAWVRMQPAERPLFVLHETLGALGYDDEDYQISLALKWLVGEIKNGRVRVGEKVEPPFRTSVKRSSQEKIYVAEGGSSLVGGGGSECEIFIKQALYDGLAGEPRLRDLAVNARIKCDPVDKKGIDLAGKRVRPFTIRRQGKRLMIRTSALVEIVAPYQPWIKDFMVREFRAFAGNLAEK